MKIGTQVKILGGMAEFIGKLGRVVGSEKYGRYEPTYYRVRLHEPVTIPGVGRVTDDLWQKEYLKRV